MGSPRVPEAKVTLKRALKERKKIKSAGWMNLWARGVAAAGARPCDSAESSYSRDTASLR